MTFDPGVPNAGQSPAFYPTQNQTNMNRLKAIINAEHQFNDTAQSTDGVHKQVTYINRAAPGSLPVGTNSILYAAADSNGASQLHFYNGATDIQLTPPTVGPIRVQGTTVVALASGGTFNVPDLPTQFTGTGYVFINGSVVSAFHNLIRINGHVDEHQIDSNGNFPINPPEFRFNGTTLQVRNNSAIPSILVWSLILNSI